MTKTTDQFKVGDKVKWTIEGVKYQGRIETITAAGACALVRQPEKRLDLVPLSMLKEAK